MRAMVGRALQYLKKMHPFSLDRGLMPPVVGEGKNSLEAKEFTPSAPDVVVKLEVGHMEREEDGHPNGEGHHRPRTDGQLRPTLLVGVIDCGVEERRRRSAITNNNNTRWWWWWWWFDGWQGRRYSKGR